MNEIDKLKLKVKLKDKDQQLVHEISKLVIVFMSGVILAIAVYRLL